MTDDLHCAETTSRKPYHCGSKPEYRVQINDGEWITCHRHLAAFIWAAFQEDGKATVLPLDPDDWRWRRSSDDAP